jgi:hypothetical protein
MSKPANYSPIALGQLRRFAKDFFEISFHDILTSRLHELLNFWRFLAKPLGISRSAIKD